MTQSATHVSHVRTTLLGQTTAPAASHQKTDSSSILQENDGALLQMMNNVKALVSLKGEQPPFGNTDEARGCFGGRDLNSIIVIQAERLGLKRLPAELEKFSNLTVLYLSGNQLASLPDEICRLDKLVTVILSDNQLTSLPENFGDLKGLEQLIIKRNRLKTLPQSFVKLEHLENCRLNGNRLTLLPEDIGKLKCLEYFNIRINQLTSIPNSISDLGELCYLDVTRNLLESPPNIYNLAVNGVLTILKMDESALDLIPEDKREEILSSIDRRRSLEFPESNDDEENESADDLSLASLNN